MSTTRATAPPRGVASRRKPPARGWGGRGGGASFYVQAPAEARGSSNQVCGLWPFSVGAGAPMIGVPLGPHLFGGGTVCCDPISWFQLAKFISNPSMFILGLPGLGKSTLVVRLIIGLCYFGVIPVITGDRKGEYWDVIEGLGGPVIRLGPGIGHVNVLDPGGAIEVANRLTGSLRLRVLEGAQSRRKEVVAGLIDLARGSRLREREENVVDQALRVLDDRHDGIPILSDLLHVVREAPAELRAMIVDRGDDNRYRELTEDLEASLLGLISGGRLGAMFNEQTAQRPARDLPVVFDISGIPDTKGESRAAAQLASWAAAAEMMDTSDALTKAGLEPRRHYLSVDDELWSGLRASSGMVDRYDSITRLNRSMGMGQIMVSHTSADLAALPEVDRAKAAGFIDRSGIVAVAGLPASEFEQPFMEGKFTQREREMVTQWQTPAGWETNSAPPGQGNFLIKVGERPGIPLHLLLTTAEKQLHDTNSRWHDQSRRSALPFLDPTASTPLHDQVEDPS
ncbi:MAG: ATP/GTP-binding protein [Intrasporangium sp.]|uniref:ATP/GTP-binding protein n=1 Tax=Intrasporangium sp. TaxID=1925024 RepID=UPI002649D4CE|nr:ATP/GTP-binding protein [Intrasporangium sp.]MDN5797509.1 ATP/GTP-binding protein [Intrasporangium sp.]